MTLSGHLARGAVAIVVAALLLIIDSFAAAAEGEDEAAVKHIVERFLTSLGDGNLDVIPNMFVPDANIGAVGMRDGAWTTSTMTFEEWMSSLRERTTWNRFREPVAKYTIHVEDSMMAFVRADATLIRDGQARSHNIDYFTLVRLDGVWKFLSASYVATPIAPE